jgi:phosphatidylglycerophosphate synthase
MLYEHWDRFYKVDLKIGGLFSWIPLTPNQWTFLGLFPAIISLYLLIGQKFVLAACFLLFASCFDVIDGAVARATGQVTKLGAYLDTLVDRYVEGMIALGLLFVSLPDFYLPATVWIFLYFFGSLITTYSKCAAKEKELVTEELRGGILERAERVIGILLGLFLAKIDKSYLVYMIVILAILSNMSALQRMSKAFKKSV